MNEKGFMYPLTLTILILFSMFLTVHFQQFVIEKKFMIEVEQFEKNQFYFFQSLKKMEQQLQEEPFNLSGSFHYQNGTVFYEVEELGSSLLQVTFRMKLDGRPEVSGLGYYDLDLKRMIKWQERN